MDIFDTARRSVNRSLIELYFSSTDGKGKSSYWDNGEFWTLNPLRNDKHIRTFSINESGFYNDFALGFENLKGDFIKLISENFNISLKEAAEKIIKDSGGIIPDNTSLQNKKQKKEYVGVKIDKSTEISIKDDLIKFAKSETITKDKKTGDIYKLVKFYGYREYKTNDLLFYIARYECEEIDDKKFCPYSFDEKENLQRKLPKNLKPYPLYKINKIIKNDLPILVVEGEKCADIKINGYNLVTWANGAKNIDSFDWSPLKKRQVYIFPDNDIPGFKAAEEIKKNKLPHAKILNVKKLDKHEKWDIADAAEECLDLIDLIESIKDDINDSPSIDPYYAYKQFVSQLYGEKNLIQIDGIMWKYSEKNHYWIQFKKENLQVDFQIWMEKSGAVSILDSLEKSKHSYRSQSLSFVNGHGLGYFIDNHFKYSSMSPYIHFNNGAIEIFDDGYKFHSRDENPEDYFRELYPVSCFEYDYNKENQGKITIENIREYAPLFCYFIDSIIPEHVKNDKEEVINTYKFILQMISYSMSPVKPGEYFFGFYGIQGSAKTSLFKLVGLFIGEDFMSVRPFKDFINNRFASNELWGTKIYCDNDVSENMPLPDDFIKANSGNNTITVEGKNKSPIKGVKISITMFFISNYEFKATGVEGIDRRAIIVKFDNKIPSKKRDRQIMDRVSGKKPHNKFTPDREGETFDERPFILNLIMDSWDEFIENSNIFIMPEWIKSSSEKMKAQMGSIGSFFYQICENEIDQIMLNNEYTKKYFYETYRDWCAEEGRRPKGRNKFYEDFERAKHSIYFVHKYRNAENGHVYMVKRKRNEQPEKELKNDDDIDNIPF